MTANQKFINLETAKLLKDCGVESEYVFSNFMGCALTKEFNIECKYSKDEIKDFEDEFGEIGIQIYPAFTWQEIEHFSQLFFGVDDYYYARGEETKGKNDWNDEFDYVLKSFEYHSIFLLKLRLENKYEEAELYFREHCILINKQLV